jgi:N-acetylmuramoyl-L-alanine amidase
MFNNIDVFFRMIKISTIILDAGHGGKDPGNSYHGYTEKTLHLNYLKVVFLKRILILKLFILELLMFI